MKRLFGLIGDCGHFSGAAVGRSRSWWAVIGRIRWFIAVLAILAVGELIYANNDALFFLINGTHVPWLDHIMLFITSLGDGLVLMVLVFFLFPRRGDLAIACAEAYATSGIVALILKRIVAAPRPPMLFRPELIHVVGPVLKHYSFPSGHTASAVSVGVVLFSLSKERRLGLIALVLSLLVGYSRIYVGVHFPRDVYAGALLGALAALVAARCHERLYRWLGRLSAHRRARLRLLTMGLMASAGFYLGFFYCDVMPGMEIPVKLLGAGAILFAIWQCMAASPEFGLRGGPSEGHIFRSLRFHA
ncbi:Phosphatidylglycerophosphatase B [Dissulfuribacter thermophilus]|uniref:Phosphatidylglycerophosphatase B n=1 Tax=Dissulfuribacter thermophilus TaxID=1156395 RepID=A0A1B9F721_9BACT|nr:phosphatase PAP2 family protein [Dissulfuribacter thermophilus]OCC15595.1 Phosphatidylglycerophosphatase B [Dissulfuribacter thermophilus]